MDAFSPARGSGGVSTGGLSFCRGSGPRPAFEGATIPPLNTLISLDQELISLMLAENRADVIRHKNPDDQQIQLDMDRWTTEIYIRKAEIEQAMVFIASQN